MHAIWIITYMDGNYLKQTEVFTDIYGIPGALSAKGVPTYNIISMVRKPEVLP
jgi:hypothetical protein